MALAGTSAAAILTAGRPFPTRAASSPGTKIGIIGSGHVGSALGRTWVARGHQVMFSSRNLDHDRALASKLGGAALAGTPQEAAAFGEAVLVAVPYGALPELGKRLKDGARISRANRHATGR